MKKQDLHFNYSFGILYFWSLVHITYFHFVNVDTLCFLKKVEEVMEEENIRADLLLRSISMAMYEAGSAAPKPADQE